MPLLQPQIKASISQLLDSTASLPLDESKDAFADQLATVIVNAIESATIIISPGLVQTVGSPTNQTNIVPIIIENGLS